MYNETHLNFLLFVNTTNGNELQLNAVGGIVNRACNHALTFNRTINMIPSIFISKTEKLDLKMTF